MSIALSEFWTRLVRSGITDAAGCKRLASAFSEASEGTPPSDAQTLARFMIGAGKLTKFQARALLAAKAREIRIANYVIRSDTRCPPLNRWVQASRIDDGQSGFLFRAGPDQLSGGRSEWLQANAAVTSQSLQAFELLPFASSSLVFSPLPVGRCLHDVILDGGSIPAKRTCEIGISIADALEALHAETLIHGSVRSDRVWMPDEGQAVLLRDPSRRPVASRSDVSVGWLDSIDSPESYAAPEFAGDDQVCNQATDIYSLGCLLFRLNSGRLPYVGQSRPETIAAHASETPPELADAVAGAESGDPLYRVIAFAMAKTPAARFATTRQLADALRATLPLLPGVDTTTAATVDKTRLQSKTPTIKASALSQREERRDIAQEPPRREQQPDTPSKPPESPTADRPSPRVKTPATGESEPPVGRAIPPPARPPAESPVVLQPSPLSVEDSGSASRPGRRRKKKKKSQAPLVLGGLCVAVLMLLIGLAVRDPSPPVAEKRKRPPIPDVIPSVSNRPARRPARDDSGDEPVSDNVSGYQMVSDDRLLFVPPYPADAPRAPLEMLPPGPAAIISSRLALITQHSHGSELIEALSPELDRFVQVVAARASVPVDLIHRCTAAMHPGKDGWPEVSLAIELTRPQPASELIEKWQVAASRTPEGATVYAGDSADGDAYYFRDADGESISRFAVGSIRQISRVAAAEGGAIPLPRASQALWNGSSDQADLVVLLSPNFLFADGRALLQSSAPELVRPLKRVMQPDVAAVLVTAHLGDEHVFVETRLAPGGGISEATLMRTIRESIQGWPSWAEEFIVNSAPDPSWRLLASRLPLMMRFVAEHSRYGISDRTVVVNTYLPARGVGQLTLATLLAMNTPLGGTVTVAAAESARPLTIEQMLDRKMSVSFDQESLEFAVDAIVGAFDQALPAGTKMPPVRIIGGDLQLMGITQNQQVRDFVKSDLPLRTVLTDLVLGANPDKSASGPKDPKQALIWVVAADPENPGGRAILVTTRQAAENKYELPREFLLDS